MTRVLVLGADGMVGGMVARVLSASAGIEVAGTRRRDSEDPFFLDAAAGGGPVRRMLRKRGPFDLLVNCIGVLADGIDPEDPADVDRASLVNSTFPRILAQAAEETRSPILHVSTDGVFPPDAGMCFEETPVAPPDCYGRTKALGEVEAQGVLNVRCSLVGPDPASRKGLFEWLRGQPPGADVHGYTDHAWNGVTTLQFARLCQRLAHRETFDSVRGEGGTHHFCPNECVSKYELLTIFRDAFRPDVTVRPVEGPEGPISRRLGTRRRAFPSLFGEGLPMRSAVEELAAVA